MDARVAVLIPYEHSACEWSMQLTQASVAQQTERHLLNLHFVKTSPAYIYGTLFDIRLGFADAW